VFPPLPTIVAVEPVVSVGDAAAYPSSNPIKPPSATPLKETETFWADGIAGITDLQISQRS
jgi:hypothetical protein